MRNFDRRLNSIFDDFFRESIGIRNMKNSKKQYLSIFSLTMMIIIMNQKIKMKIMKKIVMKEMVMN